MSEDNKNIDPFDFDFDVLNEGAPAANTGSSPFDLGKSAEIDSTGIDLEKFDSEAIDLVKPESEATVSADNPFLKDGAGDKAKKKKGFFGRASGDKTKPPKEKKVKELKEKKEPVAKGEIPRDWGTILCIAFSIFLLVSILMFNIGTFIFPKLPSSGGGIMQTICFLGAFNIVALAAAAVPILFYKYPNDRTLPNVMLGIAAVALLLGVQICVCEFYQYDFIVSLKP